MVEETEGTTTTYTASSSSSLRDAAGPPRAPSKEEAISFFAGRECRYPVVRSAAAKIGWRVVTEESSDRAKDDCNVIWVDTARAVSDSIPSLRPWQRINHFPGMTDIARKTRLARNLERMARRFPLQYSFHPPTFVLPGDAPALRPHFSSSTGASRHAFIVKPDGGSRGRGIFLTRRWSDVEGVDGPSVAQRYVSDPLLIDGKKFDLRLYVLVTSCSPDLRAHMFRDGLVRVATEEYERPRTSNMSDRFMHLTNYSVNRHSDKFERGDDGDGGGGGDAADGDGADGGEGGGGGGSGAGGGGGGSKRSVRWLLSWLRGERGDAAVDCLWCEIGDVCAKTVLSVLPALEREYAAAFGAAAGSGSGGGSGGAGAGAGAGGSAPFPPAGGSRPGGAGSDDGDGEGEREAGGPSRPPASGPPGRRPTAGGDAEGGGGGGGVPRGGGAPPVEGSRCFQILGFDVMIDSRLRPHLLEVNHLPSFAADSSLDRSVKSRVVEQALACVRARGRDRRSHERAERRRSRGRLLLRRRRAGGDGGRTGTGGSGGPRSGGAGGGGSGAGGTGPGGAAAAPPPPPRSAEEVLTDIYRSRAPDKVHMVGPLLRRYRGYEEWLVARVRDRYGGVGVGGGAGGGGGADPDPAVPGVGGGSRDDGGGGVPTDPDDDDDDDASSADRDGMDGRSAGRGGDGDGSDGDDDNDRDDDDHPEDDQDDHPDDDDDGDPVLAEEKAVLRDYDRIYPPLGVRPMPPPPYGEMREYAYEEERRRFERLTRPPPFRARSDAASAGDDDGGGAGVGAAVDAGAGGGRAAGRVPERGGRSGWMTGNAHLRRPAEGRGGGGMLRPPTKRQVEAAGRLCRGYHSSDEDAAAAAREDGASGVGARAGGGVVGPSLAVAAVAAAHLPSRVHRDMEEARERRRRNEDRLMRRGSAGVALKPINLNFDLGDVGVGDASKDDCCSADFLAGRGLHGWSLQP